MSETTEELRVVTLGTAGGPRWWGAGEIIRRSGIATAIAVGDTFYLVDCGHGAGRRLNEAGLNMKDLRAVFLTHLHSDHTIDLPSLAMFGLYEMLERSENPVRILGPGNRGILPPVSPRAKRAPQPVAPHCPTPGTREMFETLVSAYATDLNDRVLDGLRPSPMDLFTAEDIEIPADCGYHPNDNPTPRMEPFEIYRDELITVSAILVAHPPIAPAFGFRIDTAVGSVTISGDTAPTPNMVALARDTDLLLHEAIDFDFIDAMYSDRDDQGARASRDHHYKAHTSSRDAARIATQAGAGGLALHHLVPASAPDEVWQAASEEFNGEFILPRDLDVITLRGGETPAVTSYEQLQDL